MPICNGTSPAAGGAASAASLTFTVTMTFQFIRLDSTAPSPVNMANSPVRQHVPNGRMMSRSCLGHYAQGIFGTSPRRRRGGTAGQDSRRHKVVILGSTQRQPRDGEGDQSDLLNDQRAADLRRDGTSGTVCTSHRCDTSETQQRPSCAGHVCYGVVDG